MTDYMRERIVRIERVILKGRRPRPAMYNGRLVGPRHSQGHGDVVTDPVVRLYTSGGAEGIGWSRLEPETASQLLGEPLEALFALPKGCTDRGFPIDLPLWDLVARMEGVPLYRLLGGKGSTSVEVYDGSIYIDDIGMTDSEAVALYEQEVRTGQEHGFRHFKVKVGRGAYWMPTMEGLARDVLVVHTVRSAAGPDARVLIDANSANTLNTAIHLMRACADVGIHWFEEPFFEDRPANEVFKTFLRHNGHETLVADGESNSPPSFFDLVREGLIDVVQHDFRAKGLTWWLRTADRIAPWGALCAPHCWGSVVEHYHQAHFAAAIPNYALLESSPVDMPGIIDDGWAMRDGTLLVPDRPGAGFEVDPELWERSVHSIGGYTVSA